MSNQRLIRETGCPVCGRYEVHRDHGWYGPLREELPALTSPETIEKVAKELKRAALDNLGWSDQARAVLRAVTEDTQ